MVKSESLNKNVIQMFYNGKHPGTNDLELQVDRIRHPVILQCEVADNIGKESKHFTLGKLT
jgi:hypothetical protein